jgi:SAM-dependent methyltransferase
MSDGRALPRPPTTAGSKDRVSTSHWADLQSRWARLGPPLRPNREVAEGMARAIAGHDRRVLLLGVTPELAELGDELIGVDINEAMIAHIWPGDSQRRRAVKGDWLDLPFPHGHFTAAIGDGSLNALTYPEGHRRLYGQLAAVLQPGGRFVVRLFKSPDRGEPLAAVRAAALAGKIGSFHAFKWRLAMAIVAASDSANIPVRRILEAFEREFPDRAGLGAAAGWPAAEIDTIDAYRNSAEVYNFPTFVQLCAALPDCFVNPRLIPTGSYELAERCPLVAMELRA